MTESTLEDQKEETEKLCKKFSHSNIHNINKRIKQRDDKIETFKLQIESLGKELD